MSGAHRFVRWLNVADRLRWYALRKALVPKPPESFIWPPEHHNPGYNFQIVILPLDEEFKPARIYEADNQMMSGTWMPDPAGEPQPKVLDQADVNIRDVTVDVFRRNEAFRNVGLLSWLIQQRLGIWPLRVRWRWCRLFLMDRQALIRKDRNELLAEMVAATEADHRYRIDGMTYYIQMHGYKLMRHPKAVQMINYYDLILKSLAETGDAIKYTDTNRFAITPKAMVTVSENAIEDKRQKQARNMQLVIVALTMVLAVAASLDVYYTHWI